MSTKGCTSGCIPIALVVEHQMSPTKLSLNTLQPLAAPLNARYVDQLVAFGIHYASERHSDFDAGLTMYAHRNVAQQLSMTVTPAPSLATELGGQMMARYCW